MAEIKAFKGLVYNSNTINGRYDRVVAPPYDVIPPSLCDELYDKNEHNVIRLILGRQLDTDNEENNRYTRAKQLLNEWISENIIAQDEKEALYVYQQEYDFNGETFHRIGFLGLMKIGDPGNDMVIPHEYTLAKPKEDRLNLIKQVNCNLSPIFTVYNSTTRTINDVLRETMKISDPILDIELDDGKHRLWRLSDENMINEITSMMADKKVYIADGHHRYEVSRNYRDLQRQKPDYDGSADYVMMYFADMHESNELTVLATHRVLKKLGCEGESVIKERLGEYFDFTEFDNVSDLMDILEKEMPFGHVFGYYGGDKFIFLKPKDKQQILSLITEEKTYEWKKLDVSVLHSVVFNKLLSTPGKEGNITYLRDPKKAEELVKSGSHAAAFFLNPTPVEQLRAVAERGDMMPQKSTYFYPKLLSGLVINSLVDDVLSLKEL